MKKKHKSQPLCVCIQTRTLSTDVGVTLHVVIVVGRKRDFSTGAMKLPDLFNRAKLGLIHGAPLVTKNVSDFTAYPDPPAENWVSRH